MSRIIKFNVLTGLRPAEAVESVRLLIDVSNSGQRYYNPERQALEHFRFPQFQRQTKKAYISFVSPEILVITRNMNIHEIRKVPSYNAIRLKVRRLGLRMNMAYCRKIFATALRQSGIESEIVDMLQGRLPGTVFAKHYFRPSLEYREKILDVLNKLKQEID